MKSNEITSYQWCSWMWGAFLHLGNEKRSCISRIPPKKPPEGSNCDVYDWAMLIVGDDWGGVQSSKPKMKDFISHYQPPNPSVPTKLTETLWKHIEFNYFGYITTSMANYRLSIGKSPLSLAIFCSSVLFMFPAFSPPGKGSVFFGKD